MLQTTPGRQTAAHAALTIAAPVLFFALAWVFLTYEAPLGIPQSVFALTFVSITLEAFCFMLIGALVSGLVEVFIPRGVIERCILGNRFATVTGAAAMGFIFPVGQCAMVPVVRRLLRKGLPLPAGIAFMLATPIVNPIVIWSTLVAYQGNWFMPLFRTLLGYGIACMAGICAGALFTNRTALVDDPSRKDNPLTCEPHGTCGCSHNHHHESEPFVSKAGRAVRHARDDFFDVGRYLIVGTFIAALVRSSISMNVVEQMPRSSLIMIPAMMLLAFIVNLCSEADAFVAASFRWVVPLGAQLAFLVLGPMLDIRLLLMYRSLFRGKFIVFLSVLITILVAVYLIALSLALGKAGIV